MARTQALARTNQQVGVTIYANNRQFVDAFIESERQMKKFGSLAQRIDSTLLGVFTATALVNFGKRVIDVRSEFAKFEAILSNTQGPLLAAANLQKLQDLAKTLPFSLRELAQSYVLLSGTGLKVTAQDFRQLADVASVANKSLLDVGLALQDAITFQFERLPELNIIARTEGDKVKFTYRGITTEVNKTKEAIAAYIIGLGDVEGVSGTTAAISETLGGKLNNLNDTFEELLNTLGKALEGPTGGVIYGIGKALEFATDAIREASTVFSQFSLDFSINTDSIELAEARLKQLQQIYKDLSSNENRSFVNPEVLTKASVAVKAQEQALQKLRQEYFKLNGFDLAKQTAKSIEAFVNRTEAAIPIIKTLEDKLKKLREERKLAGSEKEIIQFDAEIRGVEKELKRIEELTSGYLKGRGLPIPAKVVVNTDASAIKAIQTELDKIDKLKVDVVPLPKTGGIDNIIELTRQKLEDINTRGVTFDPLKGFEFDKNQARLDLLYDKMIALQEAGVEFKDPRFQALNDSFRELAQQEQVLKNLQDAAATFGETFVSSLARGANAAEAFRVAFINSMLDVIQGALTTAIANTIASTSILGPLALAAIPPAIAAIKAIFNASVPQLAEGGIATRATLAIVGEGGESEAILPLSQLRGLLSEVARTAANNNAGNGGRAVLGVNEIKFAYDRGNRNLSRLT